MTLSLYLSPSFSFSIYLSLYLSLYPDLRRFLLQLMEIQKRMFPNLSNFAVQIGSFVAVTNLMATRDPARIKVVYTP